MNLVLEKADLEEMERYAHIKREFANVVGSEERHFTQRSGWRGDRFDVKQAMSEYSHGARLAEFDQTQAQKLRDAVDEIRSGHYECYGATGTGIMAGFMRIEDKTNLDRLWNPEVAYAWFREDGSFYAGHLSWSLQKYTGTSTTHVRQFLGGRTPAQGMAQFIALFTKTIGNREKFRRSELDRLNSNRMVRGLNTYSYYAEWKNTSAPQSRISGY